jgi:NAD(P)-dependent dehydrogenase (short-subunit alcohol dehydrogenase family)
MTPEFGSPRTAIVTGGARRIGAAIVRALAADGWSVLIHCHRSGDAACSLADELGNAKVIEADMAVADVGEVVIAALKDMPPPALLVNNASRFDYDSFEDFGAEQWDNHLATNLRGPALRLGDGPRRPHRAGRAGAGGTKNPGVRDRTFRDAGFGAAVPRQF